MRSFAFACSAALCATATAIAHATNHAKRDAPNVLAARAWNDGAYLLNVSLGTPPQPISMLVDINATAHTLNFASGNKSCTQSDDGRECAEYGAYYPDGSSTFAWGNQYEYHDESGNNFTFKYNLSDLMTLGTEGHEKKVNVSIDAGVEGGNAFMNTLAASGNDSSILATLVDDGLIDSRSFSLWNNPSTASEAEVLFGGVNAAKYKGQLHTYAMGEDGVPRVPVRGIYVTTGNDNNITTNTSFAETQFIVSTTRFSILPQNKANQLYDDYDIPHDRYLNCSRQTEDRTITLSIGDETTISSPWDYFFYQLGDSDQCTFGLWSDEDDTDRAIVGTEFLKNMYLAIDYDAGRVGFAELNTSPGDDDIRSLEDAEGVKGSGVDVGTEGEGEGDDTDTGAAVRVALPGLGCIAVFAAVALALA
ncbi:aspartic peptidase domain-containing protein [Aspergillus oleicola]